MHVKFFRLAALLLAALLVFGLHELHRAHSQDPQAGRAEPDLVDAPAKTELRLPETRDEVPSGSDSPSGEAAKSPLIRMTKDYDLWIDPKRKVVVIEGEVSLREGLLEMFACPKQTKEHESIVSVNCKAQYIHAALLAVGAKPGNTVQFQPSYVPASGTPIDVFVLWKDAQGNKHQSRAQEWIRHVKSGKTMDTHWVFAGSSFWTDERDNQRYYSADGGDFICVSNFPTAMLDLPVESSQANSDLNFEANTEKIPPRGTTVRLVLIPRTDELSEKAAKQREQPPGEASKADSSENREE